jgi:hypothetical protein
MHLNFYRQFRQNRKTEEWLVNLYKAEHPLINSGISADYIADFLGITPNSYKRMLNNIQLNLKQKK